MARRKIRDSLYDPATGGQAVRLEQLHISGEAPFEPPRTNYFTIYLVRTGSGTFRADESRFAFEPSSLLFFVPYQHIRLVADSPAEVEVIQFHANFLCVETFHAEVGCSGVLFNDPHGMPLVPLDGPALQRVQQLVDTLKDEQARQDLAFSEVMLAQLKVLLIVATRHKSTTPAHCGPAAFDPQHPLLIEFRELIEQHYRTLHSPAEYARLLHTTAKTLGRTVREHLGTTPTELIRARVLTHAKWQLLHTLRPVKEIAREVGFRDELYFSRLFRKATGCSPTFFREFETEIRGGSNLSMVSSPAPILDASPSADTSPRTEQNSKQAGK